MVYWVCDTTDGDWGYARVSSDEQAKGHSIDNQIARLKAAGCSQIFADVESAYKKGTHRPDFEQMMECIQQGQARGKCLKIPDLERLARNEFTSFWVFETLEAYEVKLVILDQPYIDLDDPEGRVLAGHSVLQARAYSARLSRKVKRGHQKHRDRNAAYFPPFGYVKNPKTESFELDHRPFLCLIESQVELSKAAIGRDMVEVFSKCRSLRRSLITINEKYGITSHADRGKGNRQPRGKFHFHASGFGSWLNNPILRGHLAYGRGAQQRQSHKHLWDLRYNTHSGVQPDGSYDPDKDHRLMTDEEYRSIEEILDYNAATGGFGFKSEVVHPLSGLIYCEECRGKCRITHFRLRTDPSIKKFSYQCNNYHLKSCRQKQSVREHILEQAMIDALCARAETIASLAKLPPEQTYPPELLALKTELAFYEQAPGTRAEAIKADLRRQIDTFQIQQSVSHTQQLASQELLLQVFGDRSYWKTLLAEEKRELYRNLVDRVVIRAGQVERVELKV
jgi:site-specific DNA recombinase